MQDTTSNGRVDIVIFPTGGREILGRVASYPETPETAYMPLIAQFVSEHQGLKTPQKFTGYYSVKDGVCSMQWANYAGELPQQEPEEIDFDAMMAEARAEMGAAPQAEEVIDV